LSRFDLVFILLDKPDEVFIWFVCQFSWLSMMASWQHAVSSASVLSLMQDRCAIAGKDHWFSLWSPWWLMVAMCYAQSGALWCFDAVGCVTGGCHCPACRTTGAAVLKSLPRVRLRSHRHECKSDTVQVLVMYINGATAAIHIHTSMDYL